MWKIIFMVQNIHIDLKNILVWITNRLNGDRIRRNNRSEQP